MKAQTANPGGVLDPAEVVGRDKLVARLWAVLEKRSLYITAERRMGKTSVVRDKMSKEPPIGVRMVYLDVSQASSPLDFVEKLLNGCSDLLDFGKKAKLFISSLGKWASNLELKASVSIKLPADLGTNWKSLLDSLLRDLAAHPDRVVLAFDEMPLMLLAIKRNTDGGNGESVVMELLDTLRAARQTNLPLRMIYTGSLGLHHVLTVLKEQGYQNDPTNDMALIEVEPLSPEDAAELALQLLNGEKISSDDPAVSAQHLASVTDGMPYYIQHLIEELEVRGESANIAVIDKVLASRLTDMRDPWHLRYYDERIDTHYAEPLRPIARAILDQLALPDAPVRTFEELVDGINPALTVRDPETVRNVLRLLGADHYVSRDESGSYLFRYSFIARVWRAIR